jgi:hypothetical protein
MHDSRGRHWFSPYHFIVTLPDRLYPFSCYIDGQRVRWSRSYEYNLARIQERMGQGKYGFGLCVYRGVFHVLGAGILIVGGTWLSKLIWGNDAALPVLFLLAMAVITYQEFILQPRTYHQKLGKGITDWISWAAPLGLYLSLLFY